MSYSSPSRKESSSSTMKDQSFKHCLNLTLDRSISHSDRLRSQIAQIDALKRKSRVEHLELANLSDHHYELIKLNMIAEMNRVMDTDMSGNAGGSDESVRQLLAESGREMRLKEWKSELSAMSGQELKEKFGLSFGREKRMNSEKMFVKSRGGGGGNIDVDVDEHEHGNGNGHSHKQCNSPKRHAKARQDTPNCPFSPKRMDIDKDVDVQEVSITKKAQVQTTLPRMMSDLSAKSTSCVSSRPSSSIPSTSIPSSSLASSNPNSNTSKPLPEITIHDLRKIESMKPKLNTKFSSAKDVLITDAIRKGNSSLIAEMKSNTNKTSNSSNNVPQCVRKVGLSRNNSSFTPPMKNNDSKESTENEISDPKLLELLSDSRLANLDKKMVANIYNEIMESGAQVTWNDIAGLTFAKEKITEIVVWPLLKPELFTGLRSPPKGLLLFGPPGTGKTLIGKCIAAQSKSTFFSISASSLTSKWIGEGEKMVRTMFAVARCLQPSVIFIDEVDSLLTSRSDTEHESSRRLKTEFLCQFDGVSTDSQERLLIVGATNRPQELDEAARRRFSRRLYIPLPDQEARIQMIHNCLKNSKQELSDADIKELAEKTDGYSGADMTHLCRDAAMGPLRSISMVNLDIVQLNEDDIRPIQMIDFENSLQMVKSSVSPDDLGQYLVWDKNFGTNFVVKK